MANSNQHSKLYCLVMAGGRGTRFWPESTFKRPKQYLDLVSERSLLQETLLRFEGLVESSGRFIVTVKDQEILASEKSKDLIAPKGLIFEPSGRNTAPCILLSLASLERMGASKNDVVCIVPSDHVILNKEGFKATLTSACDVAAANNSIVTIGVPPTFPHTGFGYIHRGQETQKDTFQVKQFKEKPNFEVAKGYVASGEYFWNAGMFVAKIGVLLEEFKTHASETFSFYEELKNAIGDEEKLAKAYAKIPSNSIDYAVMEKSNRVMVTPARFDWNDLGSWDALEAVMTKTQGNMIRSGRPESFIQDAENNIVFAPHQFVSIIGVNDLIVVSNKKALLVLPKKDSQKVKDIVDSLKNKEWADDLI